MCSRSLFTKLLTRFPSEIAKWLSYYLFQSRFCTEVGEVKIYIALLNCLETSQCLYVPELQSGCDLCSQAYEYPTCRQAETLLEFGVAISTEITLRQELGNSPCVICFWEPHINEVLEGKHQFNLRGNNGSQLSTFLGVKGPSKAPFELLQYGVLEKAFNIMLPLFDKRNLMCALFRVRMFSYFNLQ